MGINKTEMVFTLILLNAFIVVFLGLAGGYVTTGEVVNEYDTGEDIGIKFNIVQGIKSMPSTFNVIYFGSLGAITIFLFVTSLPFFNVH